VPLYRAVIGEPTAARSGLHQRLADVHAEQHALESVDHVVEAVCDVLEAVFS
jgi:hypothetical protein